MKLIETFIHAPGFSGSGVRLEGYLTENHPEIDPGRLHPAILLLPGGGYSHLSVRERIPVAQIFSAAGIQVFTLEYSVAPAEYPQALCETLAALSYIRTHADIYHIRPDNIAVGGFSAGGHLALCAAALWRDPEIQELLGNCGNLVRPNRLVLSYPVVSSGPYGHQPSFDCLLGSRKGDNALRDKLSMEKQINNDFPPVFLWHTFTDNAVPVQNSLLLAMALAEHKIPLEMHIFPEGDHGLSVGSYMGNGNMEYGKDYMCSAWVPAAIDFLYSVN